MFTLGIDLSTDPKKTGVRVIEWTEAGPRLRDVSGPWSDTALLDLIEQADVVGIDVPLGWSEAFVAAVSGWNRGRTWPGPYGPTTRAALCYRATDRWLQREHGAQPLSVATDRLGAKAMRAAGLLAALDERRVAVDRTGLKGRAVEVYPAAALAKWGLRFKGYKGTKEAPRAARESLVDHVARALALSLDGPQRQLLIDVVHEFDTLVSALVARASRLPGGTLAPDSEYRDSAACEGWIHVPLLGLGELMLGRRD
jgi:predicted nuclease with RNAse H fold